MKGRPVLIHDLTAAYVKLMAGARKQVLATLEQRATALVAAGPPLGPRLPPAHVSSPGTVFDVQAWVTAAEAEVGPALEAVIVDAAARAALAYSFELGPSTAVTAAVAKHVAAVDKWGVYLQQQVSTAIEQGLRDGLSIPDMAAMLSSSLGDDRATLIARSEAISASNAGDLVGWRESGVAGSKTWLATMDDRCRPEHAEADGQTVGLDEQFEVGGESCDYPGDPALSPENSCNCRCTMTADTADGEPTSIDVPDGFAVRRPRPGHARHVRSGRAAPGQPPQEEPPVPPTTLADAPPTAPDGDTAPDDDTEGATRGADSAMIALYPTDPTTIAQPGGDAPEALHVTLAFLGDAASLTDDASASATAAVADGAAAVTGPVAAAVSGCGVLGDEGAVVLFLQAPEIEAVHDAVWAELGTMADPSSIPEQHPSFIAHLTLGYPADDQAASDMLRAGIALVGTTVELGSIGLEVGADPPTLTALGTADTDDGDTETQEGEPAPAAGAAAAAPPAPAAPAPDAPMNEPALEAGLPVMWTDETGADRTGVIVGLDNVDDSGDMPVGTVTIAPDDSPDAPVEVDVALVCAIPATDAAPAPKAPAPSAVAGAVELAAPTAVSGVDGEMRWRGPLVVEGVESGDGRMIAAGALGHRDLPLTLMVMFRNPDGGEGHAAAEVAGRIDNIFRPDDAQNEVWGEGVYDDSDVGREAFRMLGAKMLRGVSVDLCDMVAEFEAPAPDENGEIDMFGGKLLVTQANIMGATQTAFPAFAQAFLEVVTGSDDPALVASAARGVEARVWTIFDDNGGALVASAGGGYAVHPPAAWFEDPQLTGPVPVRVGLDGRVYGHVAAWDSCHISWDHRKHCEPPPRSQCAYAAFRTGQTLTAEGTLLPTGPVMVDSVHPDLKMRASDAQAFYAHTGSAAADVVVGEDQFGIWIAGALRSTATDAQVRALRGGDVSPDWRYISGYRDRECVAMLAVNNSGFKVAPALVASAGGGDVIVPGSGPRALIEGGKIVAQVGAGRIVRPATDGNLDFRVAELEAQIVELTRRFAPVHHAAVLARARRVTARTRRPDRAKALAAAAAATAPVTGPSRN